MAFAGKDILRWARRLTAAVRPRELPVWVSPGEVWARYESWAGRLDSPSAFIGAVADAAESAAVDGRVADVLETLSPGYLARIEGSIRHTRAWGDTTRAAARHCPEWPDHSAAVRLMSMASDGRVRERAVRVLAEWRNGKELPFLLLRLNDWVEPVRELAETALADRLDAAYARHWARHMPLIARVEVGSRAAASAIPQQVIRLLTRSDTRDVLRPLIAAADPHTRRAACWVLLSDVTAADTARTMRACLDSPDNVMSLHAARNVGGLPGGEERDALIEYMSHVRVAAVRREAVYLCAAASDAVGRLRPFLLDPNASVRQAARSYLRQRDDRFDFAEYYRRRLHAACTPPRPIRPPSRASVKRARPTTWQSSCRC